MRRDDGIADLARRVAELEDHRALQQLFGAFGPVIDSSSGADIAAFYSDAGEYHTDVPGVPPVSGRAAIAAAFESTMHRNAVEHGAGHVLGLPHIVIRGDRAEVIAHTVLYLRDDAGWRVGRVAANRFWCERGQDGWRIVRRINRQLGASEARALFREAALDLPWAGPGS